MTRAGHVVTEVLVRGITDGWRDDGSRSDRPLTRDVTAAHTVKGKTGAKGSLGAEANLRASVRPRRCPTSTRSPSPPPPASKAAGAAAPNPA